MCGKGGWGGGSKRNPASTVCSLLLKEGQQGGRARPLPTSGSCKRGWRAEVTRPGGGGGNPVRNPAASDVKLIRPLVAGGGGSH